MKRRRRGRPPTAKKDQMLRATMIRSTTDWQRTLRDQARRAGVTMSALVRRLVEENEKNAQPAVDVVDESARVMR